MIRLLVRLTLILTLGFSAGAALAVNVGTHTATLGGTVIVVAADAGGLVMWLDFNRALAVRRALPPLHYKPVYWTNRSGDRLLLELPQPPLHPRVVLLYLDAARATLTPIAAWIPAGVRSITPYSVEIAPHQDGQPLLWFVHDLHRAYRTDLTTFHTVPLAGDFPGRESRIVSDTWDIVGAAAAGRILLLRPDGLLVLTSTDSGAQRLWTLPKGLAALTLW